MASVSFAAVRKSFGATHVVRSLDLIIAAGEMVALLGPSGCGKTTTLRMLAGLERPDAGTIRIGDREVFGPQTHVPPEQRGLGMVFQSYAVWPHRTVFENVAYPLRLKRLAAPELKTRVRAALSQVRLEHLADRWPHQLSGGQLQRVALARALVAEPKVLLLDEPLSNLDAALREELRGELAALRARLKLTMIYVTHDQTEALALADRVAVMNHGVIEQIDSPRALYQEPATPFVAKFVGGANLLDGVVEQGRFVTEGVALPLPANVIGPSTGPATLMVRPEDVSLGQEGTDLALSAALYLGHSSEYRFMVGSQVLKAVGPTSAMPPRAVTLKAARLFAK